MIKKIYLTTLLLTCTSIAAMCQRFSKNFGEIAKDEIELKECPFDKDAEAVVLFDKGKSYFVENESSFDVVFERTTRIKILSEAGIKWAEVEIPFYQEGNIYEKIYDIEASSYNFESGRLNKTVFNTANTFDEKENEYWNIRKFAIPNVKVGSVIEYRYKINSEYKFNFRDWEFQWRIPVFYSEYETKMIPFYEYVFRLQGANKFDIYDTYEDTGMARRLRTSRAYGNNTYHDMVYKFGMENIPAFGSEEFITSINDYIIKLNFQLSKIHYLNGTNVNIITTWEELIKELSTHPDFGKYESKSEKLASKLFDVKSLLEKPEIERFNFVLDYVKSNYSWNNMRGKFASKNPNQFVDDKIGNCADLNLFTVGLLNGVGVEAYPVILSTRDNGKINSDYPFSHFFNYVIVSANIDGKIILADATEIQSMNNRIPIRCSNDQGLVIKKDDVSWVRLECLYPSNITTFVEMNVSEDDISADLFKMGTEYDALYFRENYTDNVDNIKQLLSSKNYSLIDSSIVVQNQENKIKPYKLRYTLTAKPEVINGKIYVSPFLQETIGESPFTQKERTHPIDMVYPKQRGFKSMISLPPGYTVDFAPADLKIENELFELDYSSRMTDGKLQINLYYYFKKPIYKSDDYSKLRYYYDEIVKKGNDKIVLVKG